MDSFRIGIIGYGRYGRIHHHAIATVPGMEVTCVCVGTENRANEVRKELDLPVYTRYDELLNKEKVDVIDIVSPNFLHAEQASTAMKRNKDVFIEKPIALTLEDGLRLLEVKKKTSTNVLVGFEYRFAPFWFAFKNALQLGVVTNPKFAKIESYRGPFRTGSRGWRYDTDKIGNPLLEEAIHYFDLALWYFGQPDKVSAFGDSSFTERGNFGTAVVHLEYEDGLNVMIVDTLNGVGSQNLVSISGEGGAMIGMLHSGIETPLESAWVRGKRSDGSYFAERKKVIDEVENTAILFKEFVDRSRRGEEPPVTLADGFNALSLDLAAVNAIKSGGKNIPRYA